MSEAEAMEVIRATCAAVQTQDWQTRTKIHDAVTTIETALAKATPRTPAPAGDRRGTPRGV